MGPNFVVDPLNFRIAGLVWIGHFLIRPRVKSGHPCDISEPPNGGQALYCCVRGPSEAVQVTHACSRGGHFGRSRGDRRIKHNSFAKS